MKKMLVIFLILFTCVLADTEEDKYVDLLPEDEKLQFIEQVAKRILKDVHSQEKKPDAKSTEINDEQLRKHNEYVRAVLKEETEYIRRRKSELAKDKIEKGSEESGKAFDSEKIAAIPDDGDTEQVDLTLRNDRRDNANPPTPSDYIKVEIITDEVPIIKRSIQNDESTKAQESDETTAETLVRVDPKNRTENFGDSIVKTPTVSTIEKTNEQSATVKVEALAESKSDSLDEQTDSTDVNKTEDKVIEKEEITTVFTTLDKVGSVPIRRSGSGEADRGSVAQSDTDEPWMSRRQYVENNMTIINNTTVEKAVDVPIPVSSAETTTTNAHKTKTTIEAEVENVTSNSTIQESITLEPLKITTEYTKVDNVINYSTTEENNETEINNITAITSAVELFGLKSEEKTLDESNHISSEEITTTKAHKTKTTTDKGEGESFTEENDETEINDIASTTSAVDLFGLNSSEKTVDESNQISSEETTTTKKARKIKTTTKTEVESTTNNAITESADEPRMRVTDVTNIDEETTTIKHARKTKTTTETEVESATNNPTTESAEEQIRASNEADTETATESTIIISSSGERTTQPVPSTIEIEKATEKTIASHKTTEKYIIVEEFTKAPKKTIKKKFKSKNNIKPRALVNSREFVSQVLDGSGKYVETGTMKSSKVKLNKLAKVILGPKGHEEILQTEKPNPDKNFIELEKVYYDNNYKVKNKNKKGKAYQIFEIKPEQTPFIRDEKLSMVEQPYYVPIYNYSPNNAYFNPQNRLGPNPGDETAENNEAEEDFEILRARPEKNNYKNFKKVKETDVNKEPIDMEYDDSEFDDKRKKFGSKQKEIHSIHKQPVDNHYSNNNWGKVNPDDYADADYYFGRKDKRRVQNPEELNAFPNSDENDHPAHSIQEGNLKDHVRAVRNILFHQKSFGLLDKDKYGHETNAEKQQRNDLRQGRVGKYKKSHALRNSDPVVNKKGQNVRNKNTKPNVTKKQTQKKIEKENDEKIILEAQNKDNETTLNDKHIKKVGYLKNNNSTKELYIIDDDFRKDVQKYLEYLKQNEKDGLHPATPLPQTKTQSFAEIHKTKTQQPEVAPVDQVVVTKNAEDEIPVEPLPGVKSDQEPTPAKQKEIISQLLKELPEGVNLRTGPMNLDLNNRRKDEVKLGDYLKVLKDMVNTDDNALKQYDWLGSTVDIQSAFQKMFELTGLVAARRKVHPADMEILKYVLFLHKLATEIIDAQDFGDQIRKKLALNGNRRRRSQGLMMDRELVKKLWLYLRKEDPDVYDIGAMRPLNRFLMSVQDGLFELHVAVKNVAKITKYKNQHWYDNLKDLYINTEDKNLLELLLHMTVLRLFVLIEESAKSGLEDNYILYMKKNRKIAKRTLDEMIFVLHILDEYNKLVL